MYIISFDCRSSANNDWNRAYCVLHSKIRNQRHCLYLLILSAGTRFAVCKTGAPALQVQRSRENLRAQRERGLYVEWSFSLRFLFSYFSATTGSVSRNYSIDAARSRTVCGAPSRVCVTVDRESVYSCLFHRSTTAAACGGFAAERPAGNI